VLETLTEKGRTAIAGMALAPHEGELPERTWQAASCQVPPLSLDELFNDPYWGG